jgi:2-phosphosulfolactate phosphatase
MQILRKSCLTGAHGATGLVVVIDVFRAFSCAPLFFYFGARRVILESDPEEAIRLKKKHPHYCLVGEINEVPLEGSDLGNSPSEILWKGEVFFRDKTVVHRTTAGVTGVSAAYETADEVLLGSFLMVGAIARYIQERKPPVLTLVAMGERARKKAPEDEACADDLEHRLTGKPYDAVRSVRDILYQSTAQKFIMKKKPYLPPEDPIICLQRDLFDMVLSVEREDDRLVVVKKKKGHKAQGNFI